MRKVGRNDPCPCGSGRKYKRVRGDQRVVDVYLEERGERLTLLLGIELSEASQPDGTRIDVDWLRRELGL